MCIHALSYWRSRVERECGDECSTYTFRLSSTNKNIWALSEEWYTLGKTYLNFIATVVTMHVCLYTRKN